jgi:hypothetical protein
MERRKGEGKCRTYGEAAPSLAPSASILTFCSHHPTRVGCSKTTGQVQNRQDIIGPGIAEVPTLPCVKTGFESVARVGAGISVTRELRGRWTAC